MLHCDKETKVLETQGPIRLRECEVCGFQFRTEEKLIGISIPQEVLEKKMTYNEWLQNPKRDVSFTILRKTEHLEEGLAAELELLCLAIIHVAQRWNQELGGSGFTIKEPMPLFHHSSFTYNGYDFSTRWVNPGVIQVLAEVTIL